MPIAPIIYSPGLLRSLQVLDFSLYGFLLDHIRLSTRSLIITLIIKLIINCHIPSLPYSFNSEKTNHLPKMRRSLNVAATALAAATAATAATIEDLCTVSNVQAALPANGTLLGIELIPSSVSTSIVYQAVAEETEKLYDYCNVTLSYTHTGANDRVKLNYIMPSPDVFLNRFLVTGGFAYQLNTDFLGSLVYGAATGGTDGGYGALSGTSYSSVMLKGNGSVNWDNTVSGASPMFIPNTLTHTALVHVCIPGTGRADHRCETSSAGLLCYQQQDLHLLRGMLRWWTTGSQPGPALW